MWRTSWARMGLLALAAVMMPTAFASTAHADATDGTCPTSGLTWTLTSLDPWNPGSFIWVGEQDLVTSVTPTFLVAESHQVQNDTNATATGSFTSTVAKTFSYTVGGSFFGLVSASVSASVMQS